MIYFLLLVILAIFGTAYLYLPAYRVVLAVVMALGYFLWGVYHHFKDKTLYWPVVLEYLVLAIIGMSLLIFLSLRA